MIARNSIPHRRRARGFLACAALALVPKCGLCVWAYAAALLGLGAANREICGAATGPGGFDAHTLSLFSGGGLALLTAILWLAGPNLTRADRKLRGATIAPDTTLSQAPVSSEETPCCR